VEPERVRERVVCKFVDQFRRRKRDALIREREREKREREEKEVEEIPS